MSSKEVLENIYHFLGTVLPNAHFARNWDVASFHHAFNLAEYCEKVYALAVDQPYANVLDRHIHEMGCSLEHGSSTPVNLEYLKSSSKLLCKALMQNSFIGNHVYQSVLQKAKDKGYLEELLQDVTDMKAVYIALMDTLNVERSPSDINSLPWKVKTELYIEQLKELILLCSSEDEIEQLISSYFDCPCSDVKIKEYLILSLKPTHDLNTTEKLQEKFVNELLKRITKGDSMFQPSVAFHVWNQSPSLLASVASHSFSFYKCYSNFLVHSVNLVKPNSSSPNVSCHTDFGIKLSFNKVLGHFNCLLNMNQKVSATTRLLLLSLVKNAHDSEIWKDIYSHIFCTGIFEM